MFNVSLRIDKRKIWNLHIGIGQSTHEIITEIVEILDDTNDPNKIKIQ